MGTISPDELLRLWTLDKIPLEMAMGHILQNLVAIHQKQENQESAFYSLKIDVQHLATQARTQLPSKSKNRSHEQK